MEREREFWSDRYWLDHESILRPNFVPRNICSLYVPTCIGLQMTTLFSFASSKSRWVKFACEASENWKEKIWCNKLLFFSLSLSLPLLFVSSINIEHARGLFSLIRVLMLFFFFARERGEGEGRLWMARNRFHGGYCYVYSMRARSIWYFLSIRRFLTFEGTCVHSFFFAWQAFFLFGLLAFCDDKNGPSSSRAASIHVIREGLTWAVDENGPSFFGFLRYVSFVSHLRLCTVHSSI